MIALALLAVPWGAAGTAKDVDGAGAMLPFDATGTMGILDTSGDAAARHVVFDTDTGLYFLDGEPMNDEAGRRRLEIWPAVESEPARSLWAFDFEALDLGATTLVTARGSAPLVLLSRGDASLDASILLDGASGVVGGRGAGGGGGGGGGALAVLAEGSLAFAGVVSVNGGAGGVGNVWPGNPLGGSADSALHYRGGDGGAGAVILAAGDGLRFDGAVRALVGGREAPEVSSLALVGTVAFGPGATLNGVAATPATPGLTVQRGLAQRDFFLSAGGGGAGAGGSGLVLDAAGSEMREGYAVVGGAGGLGGPGGGAGGAGAFAVAGGGGGDGGAGGAAAAPPFTSVDGGGSGGGGGGGGAYNGPGGLGGAGGGTNAGIGSRPGIPGTAGLVGGNGNCVTGAQAGGAGGPGGPATFPSSPGGAGGPGGPGSAGGPGADGFTGQNGAIGPPGTASSNGGGGGGGGGASGGDGGNGGKGGNGHASFGDGGAGGGGGGGGADTCSLAISSPGDGGAGGAGGSGTHGGATGDEASGGGSGGNAGFPECSDGGDNDADGFVDYPADLGCSSPGDDTEAGGSGGGGGPWNCVHSATDPHAYNVGSTPANGPKSKFVVGANVVVGVADTNTLDCNQDGVPGEFDGDYETGGSGGFFGYGPWAQDPNCGYGLEYHFGSVVVNDAVFGSDILLVIGADDTSGPAMTMDPVTGATMCETSGSILPGDPATDPVADPDDCLSQVYLGSGTTCGAGGDGGYWVILVPGGNPPSTGTIG